MHVFPSNKVVANQAGKEDASWADTPHDDHQGERKGERTDEILEIIKADPQITMKMISDRTGMTKRQVERALQTLKNRGIITREGSTKSGRWVVKHVTDKS